MLNVEQAVIGGVLLYPEMIDRARAIKPEDFAAESHRVAWRAMREINADGHRADLVTLVNHLRKTGEIDIVGGSVGIAALTDLGAFSGNMDQYIEMLLEWSRSRQIRDAITLATQKLDDGANPKEQASLLVSELEQIGAGDNITEARHIKDIVRDCMNPDRKSVCVKTGYDTLDSLHGGGLEPGGVTIIGAAPSIGKSQLAINIAANARKADGTPARVLYLSLEMSESMLFERLCGVCGSMMLNTVRIIRTQNAKDYTLEQNIDQMLVAADKVFNLPLMVYDKRTISADELRSIIARYHNQIDLVVLDYLQLMRSEKGQSKREAVEAGSKACKELAKRYKLPLIAIASLNRAGYVEEDTKPGLAHLKECGDIEYDADNVWMLWREKKNSTEETLELHIRKQRQGALACIEFDYNLATGRIAEQVPKVEGYAYEA